MIRFLVHSFDNGNNIVVALQDFLMPQNSPAPQTLPTQL